jgi:hypothetical protein
MKRFPPWTAPTRRILLTGCVALTLVAAAWVEENIRGERRLRAFEQACAESGRPLDYAFYRPAPIPDAVNLFRAPVLARFFDLGADPERELSYERGSPPLDKLSDALGNWMRGQHSDLTKAYDILGRPAGTGASAPGAARLVLDSLQGIRPELDALDAAALERAQAQINLGDYGLPSFRALRFFARALAVRAAAEIELGQNGEAFGDIYAALRFAEGVERFPHQLTLMMANTMASVALQPWWEGCVRGAWSESQLRQMQQVLSRFHLLQDLPVAFAATRAAYEAGYLSNLEKPWWMPEGWWKMNIVRFFELHAGGGDPTWLDPSRERIDPAAIERSDAFLDRMGRSWSPFDWLIRHEAWGSKITTYAAFGHNRLELARTACALARYRLAHGRYPAGLAELVPDFLDRVPRDVIDGEALRYTRTGESQFRLYSIGLSGIDPRSWPRRPDFSPRTSKEGYWSWSQPGG